MIEKFIIIIYTMLGFSFAISPANDFDVQIMRILIPLLFLLWFLFGIVHKKIYIAKGYISFFFVGVFLWSTMSVFYSDVTLWTIRKLLFFYSLFPIFYVLVDKFRLNQKSLKKIVSALIYGGCLISFVGIIQFFVQFISSRDSIASLWTNITPFFLGGTFSKSVIMFNSWYVHVAGIDVFRAIAFFPDPHVFSYYVGAITPFALFLYIETKEKKMLLATISLLTVNILTFSRGGEIALLVSFFVFLLISKPFTSVKFKHFTLAIIIASIFFLGTLGSSVVERFSSSFSSMDTSVTHRFVLWKEAITVFEKYPIAGVGLGAYPHEVDFTADYRKPIYVHNAYLDILVEVGTIGLLMWTGLIVSVIYTFWINRNSVYARAGIISIISLMTHSLFDTPIFSIHVFLVFALIVSIASFYEQDKINYK